jgi:hypothetical protein
MIGGFGWQPLGRRSISFAENAMTACAIQLRACAVGKDGASIIAGDTRSRVHFLRFEEGAVAI